jgi:cytochrome c-type biogenesis protein CcmH/NrfG
MDKALASYRRALQLDPKNSRIREIAERLGREAATNAE